MATKPGPLSAWPWQRLGSFKYLLLSPLVASVAYKGFHGELKWSDTHLLLLLFAASRYIHNQLWVSISRYQNARSRHQIQAKSIKFEQVDRESTWDDYILLYTLLLVILKEVAWGPSEVPFWDTKGFVIVFLVHIGPVEFVYYWLHRALHHHWLYSRYHSHHHSSFVTEPITSVVHPFAEHLMYVGVFSLGPLVAYLTGTFALGVTVLYMTWFDFMNNMGHCNFEFIPPSLFRIFPVLKYIIYSPSFHSLHHSQVNTNFCLFMPLYDFIYGTMDKSSDSVYEAATKVREERIDYVYLTHPTGLLSLFHLRLGFASFAASPYYPKWYVWLLWPLGYAMRFLLNTLGKTFTSEKNLLQGLHMQTWVIPRYGFQYRRASQKHEINRLIEAAIIDADRKGAKVLSLGLLNKDINGGGKLFLKHYENMKIRLTDGTTLAAAWIVNSIAEEEREVFLISGGEATRLENGILTVLCEKGMRVQVLLESVEQFEMMKASIPLQFQQNASQVTRVERGKNCKTWLAGRPIGKEDQMKAGKETRFISLFSYPLPAYRKDCCYETTPAMKVPQNLENLHYCENWLPRRVMSAWRVGGIVHALEDWDYHECEVPITSASVSQVWKAALKHNFQPYYRSKEA